MASERIGNILNTSTMKYNFKKHRYILTPQAIEERYGISLLDVLDSDSDISPETLPERFLDRVSVVLYEYIYSWSQDQAKSEYVLSLDRLRDGLEEAMCELCYAWLLNNTDPSIYFTGNTLKCIEVPPVVQTILLNKGLLIRGRFYNITDNELATRGVDY